MTVLDTSFLIDVMQGRADATTTLAELMESYDPVTVSAITVTELHHGIARCQKPEDEADRVRQALEGVTTYPIRHGIAARAGEIDGQLAANGAPVALADVLIAATAMHHNESVLTRNTEDFGRIEGVEIRSY